jgi:predicted amidohydrolase
MQTIIRSVEQTKDPAACRKIRLENIKRFCELIEGSGWFGGGPAKIYLFPEFSTTGVPWTESVAEVIERYAIYMPGEELDLLCETAKKFNCYICGNNWQKHDDWPGRIFNSSFLIGPEGKLLGTYWRNHTGFGTNPHDFLDAFVKKYGWDKLFPVFDTPLGKIGMFPCQEASVPEICRMYAMKGAEVILHPHGGGRYGAIKDLDGPLSLLVARARENNLYIASAGSGGYLNSCRPTSESVGYSHIIGPGGRLLAKSDGPGECIINAQFDIDRLRESRRRSGAPFTNMKLELYAKAYSENVFYRANQFLKTPMKHRREHGEAGKKCTEEMIKKGLIT